MSEKKDCEQSNSPYLEVPDFKNALKQFQKLVEKTVTQKAKERLGLCIEDDGKRYSF